MNFIKQLAATAVTASVCVIGYMAGATIYSEKLEPMLKEKLQKKD